MRKGKSNKEQRMRKRMDKEGAKAERGYPGSTRGHAIKHYPSSPAVSTARPK